MPKAHKGRKGNTMTFRAIITTTHGNADHITTTTTTTGTINANTPAAAHRIIQRKIDAVKQTYKLFPVIDVTDPNSIMYAAFCIAYKSAKKSTERGGTATQWVIRNDLGRIASGLRCVAGIVDLGEYVTDMLPAAGQDAQEFVSESYMGLMDGYVQRKGGGLIRGMVHGATPEESTRAAYLRLNAYIYGLRSASQREISTEYIIDGGGDIVEIRKGVAMILGGDSKWIPQESATLSGAELARLDGILHAAAGTLSKAQRDVWALITAGYSQAATARKLHRQERTIKAHVAVIRGKIHDHMTACAPDMLDMLAAAGITVDGANVAISAANAGDRRTDAGKVKKASSDKATQAARAAAYRARKKAAANGGK